MSEVTSLKETLDRILKIVEIAIPTRIDEIVKKQAASIVEGMKNNLSEEAQRVGKEMIENFKKDLKDDLNNTNMKQIEDIFSKNIENILQEIVYKDSPKVTTTGGSRKYKKMKIRRRRRTKKSFER